MRFLTDANLPRSAAVLLRQMGHDAIDVRDIGMGARRMTSLPLMLSATSGLW
jgi:hypothetical protein